MQEDVEAIARLNALEKIIEAKFDDLLVENIDSLFAMLNDEMNVSNLIFEMTKYEDKIEISHKGHYQTEMFELLLELEDSTQYTVSVF